MTFERDFNDRIWMTFVGIPVLSIFVIVIGPSYGGYGCAALVFALYGALLVFKSKFALKLRTKKVIEWGFDQMAEKEKHQYWAGYVLIGIGLLVALLLRLGLLK